jgi:uncharacterized phage-associated protein
MSKSALTWVVMMSMLPTVHDLTGRGKGGDTELPAGVFLLEFRAKHRYTRLYEEVEHMKFQFDEEKAIAAILYILNKLSDCRVTCDLHKLSKILYFAEREHLATWGRPVTGDFFVAMQYGPVPSHIYDMVKSARGDSFFIPQDTYTAYFEVNGKRIVAKQLPDVDLLPESAQALFDKAIEENCRLSFNELVEKSHDTAWKEAAKDDKISYKHMAQEAGASSEMLAYLRHNAENSFLLTQN